MWAVYWRIRSFETGGKLCYEHPKSMIAVLGCQKTAYWNAVELGESLGLFVRSGVERSGWDRQWHTVMRVRGFDNDGNPDLICVPPENAKRVKKPSRQVSQITDRGVPDHGHQCPRTRTPVSQNPDSHIPYSPNPIPVTVENYVVEERAQVTSIDGQQKEPTQCSAGGGHADHPDAMPVENPLDEASILNSTDKFMGEFRRVIKEAIPTAKFSTGSEYIEKDVRLIPKVWDILKERQAYDEGVLLAWFHHTANENAGNRGYFGTGTMLACLRSFEQHIPPPDLIAKRRANRMSQVVKPTNVIEGVMVKHFTEGYSSRQVKFSCQMWGMQITAMYLAKLMDKDEARSLVLETVRTSSKSDANGILSVTSKFETLLGIDAPLSDWRSALADVLNKVGELDKLSLSENDKSLVMEFLGKYATPVSA